MISSLLRELRRAAEVGRGIRTESGGRRGTLPGYGRSIRTEMGQVK